MRVEPPFRAHAGMSFPQMHVPGPKPFLVLDFLDEERMVERAAHPMQPAEQFAGAGARAGMSQAFIGIIYF